MLIRLLYFFFLTTGLYAQSVSPVLAEYTGNTDGKITVKNNTLEPMVVLLEARSFAIGEDGTPQFRPLDPGIHLELSATSLRLAPQQTYYVFYKVKSETLPAWFTVYATFTGEKHSNGLDLRIMLPHTVYLYQKSPIRQADIHVITAAYTPEKQSIQLDLENISPNLGRAQSIEAVSGRNTLTEMGGFPLTPGSPRHLDLDWKEKTPPETLLIHFEHFTLKQPIRPPVTGAE